LQADTVHHWLLESSAGSARLVVVIEDLNLLVLRALQARVKVYSFPLQVPNQEAD
jgi:hypothetical protein